MPFPPTCQSPATCDNRPIRKIGNTWLCLACFEYTEHHKHLPIPEEPMSEPIHDQIRAYVQKHGPTHMKQLSAALNIGMSSISSAAATLRRAGHITPASGDGVIRLTPAPADSALPDAAPDEDTVQTSEADVLRAEIGRLTERLSSAVEESMQRAKDLEITREKLRKCQHYSATADSVMEQMRRAAQKERAEIIDALGMDRDQLAAALGAPDGVPPDALPGIALNLRDERDALKAQLEKAGDEIMHLKICAALEAGIRGAGPAVRLEWSPWQQDSGIWETYLRLKTGNIDVSIGQIVYQHRIYEAALHHSDRDGGVTTKITGTSLADVGIVYVAAMQSAGLPVVSIPTLPESA